MCRELAALKWWAGLNMRNLLARQAMKAVEVLCLFFLVGGDLLAKEAFCIIAKHVMSTKKTEDVLKLFDHRLAHVFVRHAYRPHPLLLAMCFLLMRTNR